LASPAFQATFIVLLIQLNWCLIGVDIDVSEKRLLPSTAAASGQCSAELGVLVAGPLVQLSSAPAEPFCLVSAPLRRLLYHLELFGRVGGYSAFSSSRLMGK